MRWSGSAATKARTVAVSSELNPALRSTTTKAGNSEVWLNASACRASSVDSAERGILESAESGDARGMQGFIGRVQRLYFDIPLSTLRGGKLADLPDDERRRLATMWARAAGLLKTARTALAE